MLAVHRLALTEERKKLIVVAEYLDAKEANALLVLNFPRSEYGLVLLDSNSLVSHRHAARGLVDLVVHVHARPPYRTS